MGGRHEVYSDGFIEVASMIAGKITMSITAKCKLNSHSKAYFNEIS